MANHLAAALADQLSFDTAALNLLLENMQESVVLTTFGLDPPGPVILHVNSACERMTGYSRAEILGRTPRLFQGPRTSRAELDRMRAELSAGQCFEGEAVNYRKDGSDYLLRWAVVPVYDGFGRTVSWLSLQREIPAGTEAPRLTERALEAERKIQIEAATQDK